MTDGINERILKTMREKTQDDKLIGKFLEELLFKEATTNIGWFKEFYEQTIKRYAKDYGDKI